MSPSDVVEIGGIALGCLAVAVGVICWSGALICGLWRWREVRRLQREAIERLGSLGE